MAENEQNTQGSEAPLGEQLGVAVAPAPTEEVAAAPRREPIPADKHGWWWGTGRRKTAVARVRMRRVQDGEPSFQIQVSKSRYKPVQEYFSEDRDRNDCYAPLRATGTEDQFQVICRVDGGGITGQAQAIRLGVARALRDFDPNFEHTLREEGMLTRDPREVERKKYGQPGARKRFQFSKR